MCGRFTLTELAPDRLITLFSLGGDLPEIPPRYNIAPTQPVATVIHDVDAGDFNRLTFMRWGLIPGWSKDPSIAHKLINARAETLPEKPSFRTALRQRRCLILANGFYEWQAQVSGPKQPMYITLADGEPFGFAGLWERWTEPESGEAVTTCTIITTTPNELMAPIHTRMPVILDPEHYSRWLNPTITDPAQVMPLLAPYPANQMTARPVSRRVNSPAHDDPTLIEKL